MSGRVQAVFDQSIDRINPAITHAVDDPAAHLLKFALKLLDEGKGRAHIRESVNLQAYRLGLGDFAICRILGGGESTYLDKRDRLKLRSNQVGSWRDPPLHSKCDVHTFIRMLHKYQTGASPKELAETFAKDKRTVETIFLTAGFPGFDAAPAEKVSATRQFLAERRQYLTTKLGERGL